MTARVWRSAPSSTASIAASVVGQPNSAAKASKRRSPTCAEPIIAARSPRKSRGWRTFGGDHLEEVAPPLAAMVEPEWRDADAFLPDIGGGGVVGAVRRAADIALMRPVDR